MNLMYDDRDPDLVREVCEARLDRAKCRRRLTAWDEPPDYYDEPMLFDYEIDVMADIESEAVEREWLENIVSTIMENPVWKK